MTRPTGVTTVTSSTATHTLVFPNVQSQSFVPQQTNMVPVVENIGSDPGTDFQDPRSRRQNKKRGNGQQQQQQRPPPQTQHQQQRQSPPFSDYQKKFEYMEKQIAEQKRLLADALRIKQPSEADLIQKIRRELAAEAAAKSRGDSQRNVPGNPERTRSSTSQPSPQKQPSQNQQTDVSHGRVEELPDHGRTPPFYQDYLGPRGNLSGGVYRPRTDGGTQQPRPPQEQSSPHQQGASASASAPASASAHATSGQASGLPSFSSEFRHPSTEHAGRAPGTRHYSPLDSVSFREEDYRTGEQRPLFKPERHTFDATPKTEQ
jgi:hypothetical protein